MHAPSAGQPKPEDTAEPESISTFRCLSLPGEDRGGTAGTHRPWGRPRRWGLLFRWANPKGLRWGPSKVKTEARMRRGASLGVVTLPSSSCLPPAPGSPRLRDDELQTSGRRHTQGSEGPPSAGPPGMPVCAPSPVPGCVRLTQAWLPWYMAGESGQLMPSASSSRNVSQKSCSMATARPWRRCLLLTNTVSKTGSR